MRDKIALMWSMARWLVATHRPQPECRETTRSLLSTSAMAPEARRLADKAMSISRRPARLLRHLPLLVQQPPLPQLQQRRLQQQQQQQQRPRLRQLLRSRLRQPPQLLTRLRRRLQLPPRPQRQLQLLRLRLRRQQQQQQLPRRLLLRLRRHRRLRLLLLRPRHLHRGLLRPPEVLRAPGLGLLRRRVCPRRG